MRGGGCEPGRRRRCWGLTGHSLKNTHKKNVIEQCASRHQPTHTYICHPPVCLVGRRSQKASVDAEARRRLPYSAPLSRLNTVMTFSAERIDSPLKHAAGLLIAQRSILILQPQQRRQTGCNLCFLLILTCVQWHAFTHLTKHTSFKMLLKIAFLLTTCNL